MCRGVVAQVVAVGLSVGSGGCCSGRWLGVGVGSGGVAVGVGGSTHDAVAQAPWPAGVECAWWRKDYYQQKEFFTTTVRLDLSNHDSLFRISPSSKRQGVWACRLNMLSWCSSGRWTMFVHVSRLPTCAL